MNHVKTKLEKTLLENDLCAEDLVRENSRLKLHTLFRKRFDELRLAGESEKESNYKRFHWMPIDNNAEGEIKLCGRIFSSVDVEGYLEGLEGEVRSMPMVLPKIVSMIDIRRLMRRFNYSWERASTNDKREVLFNLGLNVKVGKGFNNVSRWEVKEGIHRTESGKVEYGHYFVASERTDKEWVSSGNASDEAILYTTDGSLGNELKQIMNR
tara:strand:- start:223 stop:855 length:633 start_codon:yes stop_codon:yes gene_type:complete